MDTNVPEHRLPLAQPSAGREVDPSARLVEGVYELLVEKATFVYQENSYVRVPHVLLPLEGLQSDNASEYEHGVANVQL